MPRIVTILSVIAAVLGALLSYADMLPVKYGALIVVGSAFFGALSKSLAEATDHFAWTLLGIFGGAISIGAAALNQFSPKHALIAGAVSAALIAAGKALTPKEMSTLAILCFMFIAQACGKEQIENSFAKTVVALRAARKVTTTQHDFNHIDDKAYKARLELFKHAYESVNEVGDTIAGFGEITPGNKQEVLDQLSKLATTVDKLIADGDVGVKNPQSQNDYRRWLLVSKAIISSAKVVIAAVDKPVPVKDLKLPKASVD